MHIDGHWKANYAVQSTPPFINELGDEEQIASVTLSNGKVRGHDPWGGQYEGLYELDGEDVKITLQCTAYEADAVTIFSALWELLGDATKYSGYKIIDNPEVKRCQFQKSNFN